VTTCLRLLKAERPFLAENAAAMTKMMNDMAIKPTGNIDRDFVAMMVPHHQGAIDMAEAELRYGRQAQLRRVAQEIVVDQNQQISLMRLAVGEPLPPSVSSPTDPTPQLYPADFPFGEPLAGQAPFDQPDIPISSHDRVYTADQFSNTVSVVDPSTLMIGTLLAHKIRSNRREIAFVGRPTVRRYLA
jgi:Domain of unknown function (DUF305)